MFKGEPHSPPLRGGECGSATPITLVGFSLTGSEANTPEVSLDLSFLDVFTHDCGKRRRRIVDQLEDFSEPDFAASHLLQYLRGISRQAGTVTRCCNFLPRSSRGRRRFGSQFCFKLLDLLFQQETAIAVDPQLILELRPRRLSL